MAENPELDKLADRAAQEIPNLKTAEDVAKWFQKNRMATYKRLVKRLYAYYGLA
jgi:hypothetical protein